jgi:hypothetical protein
LLADSVGFFGGEAEDAQEAFGDLVGGLVFVTVGLVVKELGCR